MADSVKQHGRVYTPHFLVRRILDFGGYTGTDIVHKHVIDNSCGDGAFLAEIVVRYCEAYRGNNLKENLETYIHGIELDEHECMKCKKTLSSIAKRYNVEEVEWDILCADTLTVDRYNGRMHYVFGNPPYVRVHNLDRSYDAVKQFAFAQQGMTDLFIVFFEVGFRMLLKEGRMCVITPSSWLSSRAGSALRSYILTNNNLSGIIDLGHFQPFEATAYTAISRFENGCNSVSLYRCIGGQLDIDNLGSMSLQDICIANRFYISDSYHLSTLREIITGRAYKYVAVKNGFATLSDKVFIGDFDFDDGTIDVLKASTGRWYKCIFPYDCKGHPLIPAEITKKQNMYQYLLMHRNELSKSSDVKDDDLWYLFGRSQAIKDVFVDKYALNTIIRDVGDIRFERVEAGKGVYSGLYILTDIDEDEIRQLIFNEEFVEYIRLLSNYKSGGYYTFASKDVEQYLNYKLSKKYGQSRITKGNFELF